MGRPKGYKHSEETIQKMRDAHIGHDVSEETKQKLSEALKGVIRSEETIQKLRDANLGKKATEETKQRMSDARKGELNPMWKGGTYVRPNGYVLVYAPNHPNVDCHNYVMEHRLVMEVFLDRCLELTEVVHHVDGDRTNNSIGNLMLFPSNPVHLSYHAQQRAEQAAQLREQSQLNNEGAQ
jgi:hypothetical protein